MRPWRAGIGRYRGFMRSRLLSVGLTLLAAALVMVACGGDGDTAAPATAETPTASSPDSSSTSSTAAGDDDQPTATGVSFASEVQPIIEAKCASCHTGDGPGTTHLEMATAAPIATSAEFIGFKVEERQMPPWPVTELTEVGFDFDLGLDPEDRDTLLAWVAEGGVLDTDPATPITASAPAFPPLDADITVAPDEPYTGPDDVRDDYRCRILDPALTDVSWLTGIEVVPDQTQVLHHAVIFAADAGTRATADERSGENGRPGWECNTIPSLGGGDLEQVTAWAPGTGPFVVPDGTGVQLQPGDYFVVQWHYHFDGDVPSDSSGLALEFASADEVAAGLEPVTNRVFLAPVEIPCAEWESGPLCDRNAAINRIRSEFGVESSFIPDFVNARCGVTADDFAQFTDGIARASCDLPVRDAQIVALWPHMHELGTEFRFTLNPGEPDERVLLDIDRWDFDWQHTYIPSEPLMFEDGDVLRMECAWDRALWPAGLESRYIVWAEGTEDEMCYGTLTTVG